MAGDDLMHIGCPNLPCKLQDCTMHLRSASAVGLCQRYRSAANLNGAAVKVMANSWG